MTATRARQLHAEEWSLLRLLQRIGWGVVEDLEVCRGKPVLDPLPRVVREIRLKPGSPHAGTSGDFALKEQHVALIRHVRSVGTGTIRRIEVQDGLPFRIAVEGLGDA